MSTSQIYSNPSGYPPPVSTVSSVPSTSSSTVVSTSSFSNSDIAIIFVSVFIVALLVVGFLAALIYVSGLESRVKDLVSLNTTGNACSGQTCGSGFYCDGNGSCQVGTGEGIGQSCGADSDCTFGLICLTSTKTCGTDPGTTPVSNMSNFQLVTTSTGTKQYLLIDQTGSFLSPTKPTNYTLNYSSSNGITFNSTNSTYLGSRVGYAMDGQLEICSGTKCPNGEPKIQLIQTQSGDIQLVNTICQTTTGGQPLFYTSNSSSSSQTVLVTSVNGSFTSGTVSKPFTAFFPVPSNNSSLTSPCPSSWETINGANVIAFSIEADLSNS